MLKKNHEIAQGDSNHRSAPQQIKFETSTLKQQDKDRATKEEGSGLCDVGETNVEKQQQDFIAVNRSKDIKKPIQVINMVAYTLPIAK